MPRIQNPLVPAEVHDRVTRIARSKPYAGPVIYAVSIFPAAALIALGTIAGWGYASLVLPMLWLCVVFGLDRAWSRRDQAFLAAHPDLTLSVPEHVRVAYLRFSADAKAVAAADVPVSVRADIDTARETAEQLLVACHSDRPEDPDEARRIQDASTELMRLCDEADELHTAVRQRTEAISARTDMVDGRDISEILAQARSRSLNSAAKTVNDETEWLAQHLDAVREDDPLDQQD